MPRTLGRALDACRGLAAAGRVSAGVGTNCHYGYLSKPEV